MSVVKPALPRHNIEDLGDSVRITIPTKKYWLTIFLVAFWVILWAVSIPWSGNTIFGLIDVLLGKVTNIPENSRELVYGSSLFILVFCSSWFVVGFAALYRLLWIGAGNEVIEVSDEVIVIRNQVFGIGPNKRFSSAHIQDLRVSPFPIPYKMSRMSASLYGLTVGQVAFDYGAKTIRFGKDIDEAEAKQIVSVIMARFQKYGKQ